MYDCIIIGGGPSGVEAAIYLHSRGKKVLLLEQEKIGGLVSNVSTVSHYLSVDTDETGDSFAKKLEKQLDFYNVNYKIEKVVALEKQDDFLVKTDLNVYNSRSIIIACGSKRKKLGIQGEENFKLHAKDITEKTNKTALVAGGGDGAIKEALYLSKFVKKVYVVEFRDGLFCIDEFKKKLEQSDNIIYISNSHIKSVSGNPINKVEIQNNETSEILEIVDDEILCFSYIGQIPDLDFVKIDLPLKDGFIDTDIATNIEGLYISGDVRVKNIRQVATAVSDGVVAAVLASNYLG